MSITLTHTRPAPAPSSAPHQTPELEPAGLADLSQAPPTTACGSPRVFNAWDKAQ